MVGHYNSGEKTAVPGCIVYDAFECYAPGIVRQDEMIESRCGDEIDGSGRGEMMDRTVFR